MNYLIAVSGGVDSVVLLDMMVKKLTRTQKQQFQGLSLENLENLENIESGGEVFVAHFDHGIRQDSANDARFVEALAASYNLPYVGKREELGNNASEELARSRRYRFLGEEALLREAKIVTAHHQDDVLETIAINLMRGTGWRGLAVLGSGHIVRPLLNQSKQEIRQYALRHKLEWVEDSTNASDIYLRNRLRHRLYRVLGPNDRQQVIDLWGKQLAIRQEIEEESSSLLNSGSQNRHFFIQVHEKVATELLRSYFETCFSWSPTRPQLERSLLAIKTAAAGTKFPFGRAWLNIDQKTFSLSL